MAHTNHLANKHWCTRRSSIRGEMWKHKPGHTFPKILPDWFKWGHGYKSCCLIAKTPCHISKRLEFLKDGSFNDIKEISNVYVKIVKEGNSTYKVLRRNYPHPNIYVEDFIQNGGLLLYMLHQCVAVVDIRQ